MFRAIQRVGVCFGELVDVCERPPILAHTRGDDRDGWMGIAGSGLIFPVRNGFRYDARMISSRPLSFRVIKVLVAQATRETPVNPRSFPFS